MKKIIERNITNEDGDFYGVCGNITRLGAYRAIRQDLRGYGVEDDVEFTPEELEQFIFVETVECPHSNEHEGWIWWGKPEEGDITKLLGKGWGYEI